MTNLLLSKAINILDRVKAYEIKIQVAISQNKSSDAIRVGLNFLSSLGIHLPENPEKGDVNCCLLELIVCLSIKHWKNHINSTLEPLLESYKIGLESGDFDRHVFRFLIIALTHLL